MGASVLSMNNVSKKFGSKEVLKKISFTMEQGDIVGYLGPNGSGKTTTLMTLVGLIKFDQGQIQILNYDVNKEYEKLYGKVAVLFDENGLFEKLTARQNLLFYLKAFHKQNGINFALNLMKKLGMDNDLDRKVSTFSKGMKRKLALVRCLIVNPRIILLDEPFDGIDVECRDSIIKLLKEYRKEHNISIILTSHVMADIEELANRIVVIQEGQIVVNEAIDIFSARGGKNLTENYLRVIKHDK